MDETSSQLQATLERFTEDRSALRRSYAIPLSSLRADKMMEFYANWRDRLEAADFDALAQDGRIDYVLFKNLLDYESRTLVRDEERVSEVSQYLPGWEMIVSLEEARREMQPVDPKEAAGQLVELKKGIRQAETRQKAAMSANSDAVQLEKTHARRAAGLVGDLRGLLKRWFTFYNGTTLCLLGG